MNLLFGTCCGLAPILGMDAFLEYVSELITTPQKKSPQIRNHWILVGKINGLLRALRLKTLQHVPTSLSCHDHRPYHHRSQHKICCQAWSFITQQQQQGGLFRCGSV